MLILTIRSDKPEAELGLFQDDVKLNYSTWQAHRELAETIHTKIKELLSAQQLAFTDLDGVVAYEGPGSFTGLRIGLTVANTIAYGLRIPIVASGSDNWIHLGVSRLLANDADPLALPEYGALPNITVQKK